MAFLMQIGEEVHIEAMLREILLQSISLVQ